LPLGPERKVRAPASRSSRRPSTPRGLRAPGGGAKVKPIGKTFRPSIESTRPGPMVTFEPDRPAGAASGGRRRVRSSAQSQRVSPSLQSRSLSQSPALADAAPSDRFQQGKFGDRRTSPAEIPRRGNRYLQRAPERCRRLTLATSPHRL